MTTDTFKKVVRPCHVKDGDVYASIEVTVDGRLFDLQGDRTQSERRRTRLVRAMGDVF